MQQQIILNGIAVDDLLQLIDQRTRKAITEALAEQKQEDQLITAKEAAKLLGISSVTLHMWSKKGLLKKERFGKTIRYSKNQILKNREKLVPYMATK